MWPAVKGERRRASARAGVALAESHAEGWMDVLSEDEWPGRAVGQRDVNSERASPSRARPASEHGGGGWREGGETASRSRRRVCVRECTLAGFGVLIYCADIKGQPVRSTPRSCTGSSPRRCLLLVGGTLVEWLAARLYQVSGSGYVHNNDCRSRRSPARRE